MFALIGRRPLRPHKDFARIWSASTVSELGSQVSLVALPFVAIATLRASPVRSIRTPDDADALVREFNRRAT